MDNARLIKISKYLSKHLRHCSARLGLTRLHGGWIAINGLLSASRADNMLITRQELDEVVRRSDKQRFSFDPAGTMIRANQGHTVQIDLELTESRPPAMLYHGSSKRSERSLAAQSQDETTLRAFVNGRKHRNGSQFAAWQTNSI